MGTMPELMKGVYKAEGDYVEHSMYGQQFKISVFSVEAPGGYLFSGALFEVSERSRESARLWLTGLLKSLKRIPSELLKRSRNVWLRLKGSVSERLRKFMSSFMINRICVRP